MKLIQIILIALMTAQAGAQFGPSTNDAFSTAASTPAGSYLLLNVPGDTSYNLPVEETLGFLNAVSTSKFLTPAQSTNAALRVLIDAVNSGTNSLRSTTFGNTNAIAAYDSNGLLTNTPSSGGGSVALTNAPTIRSLTTTGSAASFTTGFSTSAESAFTGNGTLNIAGRKLSAPSFALQIHGVNPAEFHAGIMTTNSIALKQNPVWPTNNFTGSATATNWVLVPWRGWVVTAATNYQAGGWMWQTNGPNGYPSAGAFNPATMP